MSGHHPWEVWALIDSRTGQRVSASVHLRRKNAELAILRYRQRQRLGGRPDLSHEDCQALRAVRLPFRVIK